MQKNETSAGYVLSNEWLRERERLAALEAANDPHTIRNFETIGVAPGWRCLEVGGGGGSIVLWLASRVGPAGYVVATDIDTKFLDAIQAPNISVRRHDIIADELEPEAFDLVHARFLLEHLPARDTALARMVEALRPGGWLVLEDSDIDPQPFAQVDGGSESLYLRAIEAFSRFLASAGFDRSYGRKLGMLLRSYGLVDVRFEAFCEEWGGQRPYTALLSLTFEQTRSGMLDTGLLTNEEFDEFLLLIARPEFYAMTALRCAAWGRKPG